jgi:hypothetical protein
VPNKQIKITWAQLTTPNGYVIDIERGMLLNERYVVESIKATIEHDKVQAMKEKNEIERVRNKILEQFLMSITRK